MHVWDFDLNAEAIAADISDLRLAAHLTQAELAERCQVSRTAVWNWENAKSRPNRPYEMEALRQLAHEIGYA